MKGNKKYIHPTASLYKESIKRSKKIQNSTKRIKRQRNGIVFSSRRTNVLADDLFAPFATSHPRENDCPLAER